MSRTICSYLQIETNTIVCDYKTFILGDFMKVSGILKKTKYIKRKLASLGIFFHLYST